MKSVEQIASEMLTEQWKKGELPSGEYYIIDDLGLHTTDRYYPGHGFGIELPQSVLGRVPSYEELQNINKSVNDLMAANIKLFEENTKLKERIYEFVEANQSLRKKLDEERAKNRIDYYDGSPMNFLDECERDRKKNKIYKNLINNITKELITSDLRRAEEGNKFIVGILSKINQALGEE